MENPYIKVFITPEIGGKIWGAIEKSTGLPFIYYNKVVKFRDIAMRGAWTSGGIEYNFGAIGHAPSCATPVDYVMVNNKDGSVSCFLGGMDLPSRTQWRVQVRLPKNNAYFETECTWYNPTPLHQSYYHWMNAAADAADDLQFHYPGANYIGHDGSKHQWPSFIHNKKKRTISNYKENNFGPHKSYHVMGVYTEHFGGYYKNSQFGFGNWSLYDDKPGKKLWLWALSRQGAIWKDLLTDEGNNQYIEFQSGRLLNQAAPKSSKTPFKHAFFQPHAFDRWEEIWFPFKETGGMAHASPYGVLNVERDPKKKTLTIAICALRPLNDFVRVSVESKNIYQDDIIYNKKVSLTPMQVFKDTVDISSRETGGDVTVEVGEGKLRWHSNLYENNRLHKFVMDKAKVDPTTAEGLFFAAEEEMRQRNYQAALKLFRQCVEKEPAHIRAFVRIAEIHYRQARYPIAWTWAKTALQIDAYDAGANFIYGLARVKGGRVVEAKEAFGWAARSMEYRSAAYTELAAIYLREKTYHRAQFYAWKALDYNRFNIQARHISVLAYNKVRYKTGAARAIKDILEIDPLDALAHYESSMPLGSLVRNELPHETYLELAIQYAGYGLEKEALAVLQSAPSHALVHYWRAYLMRNISKETYNAHLDKALGASPGFVFPFRNETIPVLQWAFKQKRHWKTLYYLALIHWKNHNIDEAKEQFASCMNQPDHASFYIARADFIKENENEDDKTDEAVKRLIIEDYRKATRLASKEWRGWQALANHYEGLGLHKQALETAEAAYKKFPQHYIIALDYARHLLNNKEYKQCLSVLKKTRVLPYEGAREGRNIYRKANLLQAVRLIETNAFARALGYIHAAKLWPENLGVGKPYDTDQTAENHLETLCRKKQTGGDDLARKILRMLD
jgi:tetratricopeptide (TPR) repeat protein